MRVNTWKKWLSLLLCAMLLCACASDKPAKREGEDPSGIAATMTPTETPATPTPTETPATPTPTETPATPTPTPAFGSAEEEQAAFKKFLDSVFVDMIGTNNLSVHFNLEHPEEYGITTDFELTEETIDLAETYEQMKGYAEELVKFNYDNLTDAQKVDYDRLAYEIRVSELYKDVKVCLNIFMRENNNAVDSLSTALTEYPLAEEKDLELFLKDLGSIPSYLTSLFAEMKKLCEAGYGPTQGMFDTTMDNINNLCAPAERNVLLASFCSNMENSGFDADKINEYSTKVEELLSTETVPAFKRFYDDVKTLEQYVEEPKSLASREGGKEYYTMLVQTTTGSNWSVDKMYDYLLKKAQDMISDYSTAYLKDQTITQRKQNMRYGTTDFRTILDDLKKRTAAEYPAIRDTQYTVSALPDELCVEGVLAYFLSPQADNPDRKIIRVNPKNKSSDVELFSTLAHEGYPGHLYQDEYFRATPGYHPINSALHYTGYMEGWATMMGTNAYLWATKNDADVALFFDFDYTFPMSMIGCCDIGVNYFGWGRDELRNFMSENLLNAGAADEIYEMVTADPGVVLPYSLCHFLCIDIIDELMSSKNMTKKQAYEAFLKVGPCSFDVLRKNLGITPEEQ